MTPSPPAAAPAPPSWRLGGVVLGAALGLLLSGFITSDAVRLPEGTAAGASMRCDRGGEPSDHQAMFLFGLAPRGFNHAAFEAADVDDLMLDASFARWLPGQTCGGAPIRLHRAPQAPSGVGA